MKLGYQGGTVAPAALIATTLLAAALVDGARLPQALAAPKVHAIVIEGLQFRPASAEVKAGDIIEWRNKDPFPHTVASVGAGFASPTIPPGGSWRYKAKKAGSYPYVCTLHLTMKGAVNVK